ncbi:type II secretion system minor pseudopilin GspH [Alteromonas sp. ASW11-130]|uniref:type II secretion system minor pseudopilin GspH n=1 Tax=Alteromonas sp. ASW11-130 TaxID=3015775 RepID=UPI0022424689|nr:type II secretion system minor pseudopilin GspH [Alteromonas sp. ASW11-130]MCW8093272.1 type II secretion system minor pseudopilin GspH [Alteromonas sp. ASW11-130]
MRLAQYVKSALPKQRGFTLLEVLLVLLLIGLASGYVVFNVFGTSEADRLKQEAARLQVLIDMASDYAVLNQQELGLRIEEKDNFYQFMLLDEEDRWQPIEEEEIYHKRELPQPFTFDLNLDDLPWQDDDRLFDRELFDEELSVSDEGVEIGNEENKPLPPPQVLIMSSGDVTPFTLTFNYEPELGIDSPSYFVLVNEDIPPLRLDGPLESLDVQ